MSGTAQSTSSGTALVDTSEDQLLQELAAGVCGRPFDILGPHRTDDGWVLRSFAPDADAVTLHRPDHGGAAMTQRNGTGLFEFETSFKPDSYHLSVQTGDGHQTRIDPWQFELQIGPDDHKLFAEGKHKALWKVLGAHLMTVAGTTGTRFAVWAPHARRVSVVGDFNDWDGRLHPMHKHNASGIWEIFVPDAGAGARYKYEILPAGGAAPFHKADPFGFFADLRPDNCSVVQRVPAGRADADRAGPAQDFRSPVSVYELHAGSWLRHDDGSWLTWTELAERLVPYVADLGFTHVELLPITEHPFDGSWGYQPVGLFAPTSRFGTPQEFSEFVKACHSAGLGLILDWVPAHFPRDPHGLAAFDGTALYEHSDPAHAGHPDWGTLMYDLTKPQVRNVLTASALFWANQYRIDGLRVDAVASMLGSASGASSTSEVQAGHEVIEFLQTINDSVRDEQHGTIVIAEESGAWPGVTRSSADGGLGFDYKWNMGWAHDTRAYMTTDPLDRADRHNQMTFPLHYGFDENFVLSLSHDEVAGENEPLLNTMPGKDADKHANLRAYYAWMWAHPGKKLLFMGQEFAQHTPWDIDGQLDWDLLNDPAHAGIQALVRDLNRLYKLTPALHRTDCDPAGFEWLEADARDSNVFAWVRRSDRDDQPLLAVFNFSAMHHAEWRLGLPAPGGWREVLNTDAAVYGGGNRGNAGRVEAQPVPSHGRPQSAILNLPPLSAQFFVPETN